MGTKFANLHIKTTDQEIVLDALQRLANKAGSLFFGTFYVNQNRQWSSILNDYFEWGTVEKIGELLSTFVSKPVMTIGFFDEDLFEFTIFLDGEIKIKKYFCEEWVKEEYELGSDVIDFEYLQEVLEIKQGELKTLFEMNNPEQSIDELSRMLNLHLWVHSEWVSEDEELEERYSRLEVKSL